MYSVCKIKNLTGSVNTLNGHEFGIDEIYTIQDSVRVTWSKSDNVISAINNGDYEIHNDSGSISGISAQISYLLNYLPHLMEIEKTPPFADPTHRTKRSAISAPVTCAKNDSTDVEYCLPYDKYCKGGTLVIKNAQFGDYVEAAVYDKDSVIPEAYRSALCENWPIVSTYIEKEFIEYLGQEHTIHRIRTDPLTARITQGLYVRLKYHAVDSGVDRTVVMNCDMTKEIT